jgi:hypothetical protein
MKKRSLPGFGLVVVILLSQVSFAQGLGEYGRLLGGVKPKNSSVAPRAGTPKTEPGGNSKSPGTGNVGASAMPAALIVESTEAALYARSEEWADRLTQLSRGEKLVPRLQATSANALWYMVHTDTGAIGWVKASDVTVPGSQRE